MNCITDLAVEISKVCSETLCLKCPLYMGDRRCILFEYNVHDWASIIYGLEHKNDDDEDGDEEKYSLQQIARAFGVSENQAEALLDDD